MTQAQRLGITDFFPGLGQWIEGNRRAIEAPGRARSLQQAETLLGAPAREASAETDDMGLTTGFDAYGGSGLMEDPNDFYNQMQYGLGLMGTPYYEQAGQGFMQQAVTSMLQRPAAESAARQAQANWEAEQAIKKQEHERKMAAMTGFGGAMPYENQTAYNTAANALFDDARTVTAPLRDSLRLYGDMQRTIATKGLTGMSLIDDTMLVKTLAKVQNPSEAVMEGDVKAIAASDTYDQLLRSLADKVGLAKELTPYERQTLYDALQNMGEQRGAELQQLRGHLSEQAQRRHVNPADVLMPGLDVDMTNYRGPQQVKPVSTSGASGDGTASDTVDQQTADKLNQAFPGEPSLVERILRVFE